MEVGRGCDRLEDSTTQEADEDEEDLPADTTLSPFFGTRSAIVFNEAAEDEAADFEASFSPSTLQSSKLFIHSA